MLAKYIDDLAIEVGIDEAGRGPLVGRVYASAVIWNPDSNDVSGLIRDSKKLSKNQILKAKNFIESEAIAYAVAFSERSEIDKIGILNATINTMFKCLRALQGKIIADIEICKIPYGKSFDRILVDGNQFNEFSISSTDSDEMPTFIEHYLIEKGDSKYLSIASASILAKYYRDNYIEKLVELYPYLQERYRLANNKGYGTRDHINGLKKWGRSPFHRVTFNLKSQVIKEPPIPPPYLTKEKSNESNGSIGSNGNNPVVKSKKIKIKFKPKSY